MFMLLKQLIFFKVVSIIYLYVYYVKIQKKNAEIESKLVVHINFIQVAHTTWTNPYIKKFANL